MKARKITETVYWVGALDPDRKLFEEITPLPEGTSYNSYLVEGTQKTALIDTVEPAFADVLFSRLEDKGVGRIDYVISNHAEQDHSGSLPVVLERYPGARIVCTPLGKQMLLDLLPLEENNFLTVEDNREIDLGGLSLRFIHAPWVHWPETMLTYLPQEKILFSCDLFGSHIGARDLFARDQCRVSVSAKRYYAEVMMPFRGPIKRNLEKIKDLEIGIIAPSHGPLFDKPEFILDLYRAWAADEPSNLVVLPYVSMHGSTAAMAGYLAENLVSRGVRVEVFNLAEADLGLMSMALVDAATVVFASSNILGGMHPKIVYAAYLVNALRPKARFASLIGSFGWAAKMPEQLAGLISSLKVEMLDSVIAKGYPRKHHFALLDSLAETIAARHDGLGTK